MYTFVSTLPNLTLDFLRFRQHVWTTEDEKLALMARRNKFFNKDFVEATPKEEIPIPEKESPSVERILVLGATPYNKLKQLCAFNCVSPAGSRETLVNRLAELTEMKTFEKKSEIPISHMSEVNYQKRKSRNKR